MERLLPQRRDTRDTGCIAVGGATRVVGSPVGRIGSGTLSESPTGQTLSLPSPAGGSGTGHLAALLEQAVPRYTSYPTAPHFTSAVDADTYRCWLSALPAEATLSIYLHIPFCQQLCHYCGCHTKATLSRRPVDVYARRVIDEVALVARHIGSRRVAHLHWGGGTPSILGEDQLTAIYTALGNAFDLTAVREHAIELDPRYVTKPLAKALAAIGVNRASLGVQDLDADVQRAIGRRQPFDVVERAPSALNEVGIERINLDLMYGLPGQTVRHVECTAAQVHALEPSRLAVFGYAHVPWFKPHQRLIDADALPGLEDRLAQAEAAHYTLLALGYQAIGLDHYARADDGLALAARAGRLRRNFQGYTADDSHALIGIGASAIGRLPQGFVQNAADVGNYSRSVASGRFAIIRGIAMSEDDRVRGHIIERLMCDMAVDLDAVSEIAGSAEAHHWDDELEKVAALRSEGLVTIDGSRIRLTEKGRPLARLVASAFDSYLAKGQARHSVAV
jgi:oxygen-independent coproporphyrinogen-3 oxidase